MCGLTAAFSRLNNKRKNHAATLAYSLYTAQKTRGQRGYGYMAINDGHIVNIVRSTDEKGIKEEIDKEDAEMVLFHHRMPTSTDNTIGTTHPIFVSHPELRYDYYLAHNGVITNDDALKAKHEALGYRYVTEHIKKTIISYININETEDEDETDSKFNDSECLAIEFARWIEGLSPTIGTHGAAAFWCVQVDKEGTRVENIFFGKNYGRTLGFNRSKRWLTLASEHKNGVEDMKLYTFSLTTRHITERDLSMDEARPVSYPQNTVGFKWNSATKQAALPLPKSKLLPALYSYAQVQQSGYSLANFNYKYNDTRQGYLPAMFEGLANPPMLEEYLKTNPAELPKPKQNVLPALYTAADIDAEGLDADRFVWTIDKKGKSGYLADEHFGISRDDIPRYSEVKNASKDMEKLENICYKIAEIERKYESLEIDMYNGTVPAEDYQTESGNLELERADLEAQAAATGFSEEEFEELLVIARDILEYESEQQTA